MSSTAYTKVISGYKYTKATILYREDNGDCTMQDPIGEYSIANKRYIDGYVGQMAAQF